MKDMVVVGERSDERWGRRVGVQIEKAKED